MSDHSFIKEVIKEKPISRRKVCIRIVVLIIAAILFGAVAALAFVYIKPMIENSIEARKAPEAIDITNDDEGITKAAAVETPTPTPQVTQAAAEVSSELGLAEYKKLYQEMKVVSQNAEKAIVTVVGIKSLIDYFDDPYDNKGQLSGVIIANNGRELIVLTEYRVVEGVDKIQVIFSNEKTADAEYQKHDENTGMAIIKIGLEQLDAETLAQISTAPLGNSYRLTQGEPVIAIGSPSGSSDSIAFGAITSVTNKLSSWDTEYALTTTDILGSEGGSGVLLDLDGEIIGIMAQSYSSENNTVTALAISPIRSLIQTLSNNGEIRSIGIKGREITEEIAKNTNLPSGLYVEMTKPDSPAMQAGIMNGDVIVKMNDETIMTIADYRRELDKCVVGGVVKLTVMRNGTAGYEEIVFDVMVQAL